MDLVMIVLRLLHIVAGVLWVGGAFFMFRFIEPTAHELGPKAEAFMTGIVQTRKVGLYFMTVAGITVLAGTILFLIDSAGDPIGWITRDATGLAFGLGGLAAWIAFIMGFLAILPATNEMTAAGEAMKSAGGPPTQEMVARMEAAQARLKRLGQIDLVLLGIAVVFMAIARYL